MKINRVRILVFLTFLGLLSCESENEISEPDLIPEVGVVSDIDGNSYNTVKIGNQWWMKENFKSTRYNDGTPILHIDSKEVWVNTTQGAFCNYENDENYSEEYGYLYNYYAIESGKLCPEGWRVPTLEDYKTLATYIDSVLNIPNEADALRSYSGWMHPFTNTEANGSDLVGFKALPAGYLALGEDSTMEFWGKNSWTRFWSNTNNKDRDFYDDITIIHIFDLSPANPGIIGSGGFYGSTWVNKNNGNSIRLIKE